MSDYEQDYDGPAWAEFRKGGPVQSKTKPKVELAVAGRAVVKLSELRKILGSTAYHVWELMLDHRKEDGTTNAGRATIRSRSTLSPDQVKHGLRRLREAGVVEDRGWSGKRETKRGTLPERFTHLVYGAKVMTVDGLAASMPSDILAGLRTLTRHGGPRAPKVQLATTASCTFDVQVVPITPKTPPQVRVVGKQDAPAIYTNSNSSSVLEPPMLLQSIEESARGADVVDCFKRPEAGDDLPSHPTTTDPKQPGARDPEKMLADLMAERRARPLQPRGRWDGWRPVYWPSCYQDLGLRGLVTPSPPAWDPAGDVAEQCRLAVWQYAGACRRRWPDSKMRWSYTTVSGAARKRQRRIADTLAAAQVAGCRPAGWVGFTRMLWVDTVGNDSPPSLDWVFNPKLVEKHGKWAASWYSDNVDINYMHRCQAVSDVLRAAEQILRELRREAEVKCPSTMDPDLVDGAWAKLFPRGRAAEIERLGKVLEGMQYDLNERVSRGEWLWD